MIYFLLAWLLPFIIVLVLTYTLEEDDMTVGDFLQLAGISLIPILNWCVLYIIIVEIIKNNDKIQEFLNKKIK